MGKGGQKSETSKQTPTRKTKAAVDRRQNSRMLIKAVSVRHCAATTAPRNCCPNCYAEQSPKDNVRSKLQALVYDILPSTTAVFSYAIGSRKLSASEQFFVGAQTGVSLLQTTQIKQGVSFVATNKVYTSTNKTTIVLIETELFFFYPGWMRLMITCVLWR